MPSHISRRSLTRGITAATAVATLATGLTACGGDSEAAARTETTGTVTVGQLSNGAAEETELKVSEVKSISAELPAAVRRSGKLVIGVGALPSGSAPLNFVGSDQKTLTGSEPDFGRLVAAVLGLKPEIRNSTWENLFVGVDSGKVDVAFSNVTDTEERKKKYEFASYRQDNLAFEVLKKNTWKFDGDYKSLADKTVSVGSGTNQEKILLEWKAKLAKEGKKLTVKYFPDQNSINLALGSGKIDAFFGPNPSVAYRARQTADTPNPTRNAGTFSGAGETLQGLIAATAKKDSGLAEPLADAINYLIEHGQYAKWLAAYNLSNEAVAKSEVNPPGLPLDNS
ncbi:polar amino acid transport system substrate-binding protein [Streptomyces sp. 1222.5]|uniref:transporter substrate-binding domain-containing protein n=1 Tax=unclassified Streptomyces TaxID=2593676 RepID=UPI000897A4E4|nr:MULTISPECIES: transporter substrate-binding domain-containing protein [unclassified Streptomyces]PKW11365.1 amino acid ABC transporter substrate-binding protein (PAAT family) [Streptomyces sp. 5112.2]SEB80906.1 polar amino acid transport system substrate-binding protein [Streptomyces sp. 1222.5]